MGPSVGEAQTNIDQSEIFQQLAVELASVAHNHGSLQDDAIGQALAIFDSLNSLTLPTVVRDALVILERPPAVWSSHDRETLHEAVRILTSHGEVEVESFGNPKAEDADDTAGILFYADVLDVYRARKEGRELTETSRTSQEKTTNESEAIFFQESHPAPIFELPQHVISSEMVRMARLVLGAMPLKGAQAILDFRKTRKIEMGALAGLCGLEKFFESQECRLRFVNVSPELKRTLTTLNLRQFIDSEES